MRIYLGKRLAAEYEKHHEKSRKHYYLSDTISIFNPCAVFMNNAG